MRIGPVQVACIAAAVGAAAGNTAAAAAEAAVVVVGYIEAVAAERTVVGYIAAGFARVAELVAGQVVRIVGQRTRVALVSAVAAVAHIELDFVQDIDFVEFAAGLDGSVHWLHREGWTSAHKCTAFLGVPEPACDSRNQSP